MNYVGCMLLLLVLNKATPSHGYSTIEDMFPVHAYIWELEPYIYTSKDGQYKGMVHDYFQEYVKYVYCLNYTTKIMFVKHKYGSQKEFQTAFADIQNGNLSGHPEFINRSMVTYWFPLLEQNVDMEGHSDNLILRQPLFGKSISIVAPQTNIDVVYKFILLLFNLHKLMLIFFATAVLFAILQWIFDKPYNSECQSYFTLGCAKGLWWSLLTMTTVGYGDIAPKRLLARISGSIWMVIGLLIFSTLTAHVSQEYKSDGINLDNEEIGVLRGSYEATFMNKTLRKSIKEFDNYEELITALQHRKNDMSVIALNSDVAAYKQLSWNMNVTQEQKLAVIRTILTSIPVYYGIYGDIKRFENILDGCHDDPRESAKHAMFKNRKRVHVTTIHKMPILTMLTEHKLVVTINYVIIAVLSLGLLIDLTGKLKEQMFVSKVVITDNIVELTGTQQKMEDPMNMTRADIARMAREIAEIKTLTTDMTKTSTITRQEPEIEC